MATIQELISWKLIRIDHMSVDLVGVNLMWSGEVISWDEPPAHICRQSSKWPPKQENCLPRKCWQHIGDDGNWHTQRMGQIALQMSAPSTEISRATPFSSSLTPLEYKSRASALSPKRRGGRGGRRCRITLCKSSGVHSREGAGAIRISPPWNLGC